jgi:hypothetical protein
MHAHPGCTLPARQLRPGRNLRQRRHAPLVVPLAPDGSTTSRAAASPVAVDDAVTVPDAAGLRNHDVMREPSDSASAWARSAAARSASARASASRAAAAASSWRRACGAVGA